MEQSAETPVVEKPQANESPEKPEGKGKKNGAAIALGVIFLILLASIVLMLIIPADTTSKIRDVFIIFLGLQTLIIGVALVVLVVQISILTNLIQNELKPIIKNTNETVSTLKGTATFLSDNLAKPVIKVNSFFAMIRRFLELIRPPWW